MHLPRPVRLFDTPRAPNPRRVTIFMAEKGISLPVETVDLMAGAHKKPDFLAKTGLAQVPALELEDGTVLLESPAICRYLEALYPTPNLMGQDAREIAIIEMWQRRIEFGLFAAIAAAVRHTHPALKVLESQQCADWGVLNLGRMDDHLIGLDAHLAGRDWIAADRPSVADITAFVALDFARLLKRSLPQDLQNLHQWKTRCAQRPAFGV